MDDIVLATASLLENREIFNKLVQGVVECIKKNKRGGNGCWVYFKSEAKSMKKPNYIDSEFAKGDSRKVFMSGKRRDKAKFEFSF